MRVLETSRRNTMAAKLASVAVASLGLVAVAAVFRMRGELRAVLAGAALCGYVYFAGRAVELLQGRGSPLPHRAAWRRHFLGETVDRPFRRQPR